MITPLVKGLISVQELSTCLKQLVKDAFPFVAVYGEISNLRSINRVTYFTLKDEASQIPVVLFGNQQSVLREGGSVIIEGRVDVYIASGRYQIIAKNIRPLGIGVLQQKFELLKEKLRNEGLFATEQKMAFPVLPHTIGVICSREAAALQDFLRILKRKDWRGNLIFVPALVQGNYAPQSIEKAFKILNALDQVDLIVLIRGGGSFEDLNCFNDEKLVRVLSKRKKPLLTGIGHEINTTLCDFVADLRAETPTAAAEIIANRYIEIKNHFTQLGLAFFQKSHNLFQTYSQRLRSQHQRLQIFHPQHLYDLYRLRMEKCVHGLNTGCASYYNKIKTSFIIKKTRLQCVPLDILLEKKQLLLKHYDTRIRGCCRKILDDFVERYKASSSSLALFSTEKLLQRGLVFPLGARDSLRDFAQFEIGNNYVFLHKSGRYRVKIIQKL